MQKYSKTQAVCRFVLMPLMVLTLGFIFVQSCLPADVSGSESEAVGGFLSSLFSDGSFLQEFVRDNVRKIAHFAEHGLFGAEVAIYLLITGASARRIAALAATVPLSVGFIDETIQIFSGRGPSVADVWIDIAGSLSIGTLAYLIGWLIAFARSSAERHNENK